MSGSGRLQRTGAPRPVGHGRSVAAALFSAVTLSALAPAALHAQTFDLVFRGGHVLDGAGNPAVRADVAVQGDRIVHVGVLPERVTARRVVDASDLMIAPGFIDMHSHADRAFAGDDLEARKAPNLVAQGITTVVFGPDGRNPRWPIPDEIAAYEDPGVALNVVPMVGHATVRSLVMGDDYERPATADEIRQMQDLVREGMEAGAWGLGAGPEYRPGRFSTTEELIALADVVADYDGFYYAHQRSQSPLPRWQTPSILDGWRLTATDGTKETIRIGRETGTRVVGSHIKAKGPSTWGHSSIDVLLIERARAEGVQVFLDQYPYETFGGGPTPVVPPWAYAPPGTDRSGGLDDPRWSRDELFVDYKTNLETNWNDPATRALLIEDIEHILDLQGGADRHVIVVAPAWPELVGKSLPEVAEANGIDPVEQLIRFGLQSDPSLRSGVLFRPVAGHVFDVDNYMRQDYTATSTDGSVSLRPRPGQHPRYFGSYPRKLAHYVRERGVITLPFAIRSSTSLPARIIGLPDRGLVQEGFKADLVLFDFDRVQDRATILAPGAYPQGLEYVLVNGEFTVDRGRRTGALAGRVLHRVEVRGARR
jgi:N-acyl-D-amino-acid deacylase